MNRLANRLLYQAARNAGGLSLNPRLERIVRKFAAAELQQLEGDLQEWATFFRQADGVNLANYPLLRNLGIAGFDQAKRNRLAAILEHWTRQLRGELPLEKVHRNRLHSYISSTYLELN